MQVTLVLLQVGDSICEAWGPIPVGDGHSGFVLMVIERVIEDSMRDYALSFHWFGF